jgi:hypothetical protein
VHTCGRLVRTAGDGEGLAFGGRRSHLLLGLRPSRVRLGQREPPQERRGQRGRETARSAPVAGLHLAREEYVYAALRTTRPQILTVPSSLVKSGDSPRGHHIPSQNETWHRGCCGLQWGHF